MMLPKVLALVSLVASGYGQAEIPKINHDQINPVPTTVGSSPFAEQIETFNPLLHIAHGCQPYSAVNTAGQISGGLQDSGSSSGGCRDTSKGQTYSRAATVNGRLGIMYAWYWPKDHPIDGNVAGGHRHDWESIVVWLDSPTSATPQIIGAAASGHGDFKRTTTPQRSGNSVQVEYFTTFPTNHELQFTDTVGRSYAIWDWDSMDATVQNALNQGDFGSANVPFKEANFLNNMNEAFIE